MSDYFLAEEHLKDLLKVVAAPEEEGEVDDGDDDNEPLQTTNVHKCEIIFGGQQREIVIMDGNDDVASPSCNEHDGAWHKHPLPPLPLPPAN